MRATLTRKKSGPNTPLPRPSWCHDSQHSGTQHNDIQYNDIQNNYTHNNVTQHESKKNETLSIIKLSITVKNETLSIEVKKRNAQHNGIARALLCQVYFMLNVTHAGCHI